MNLANLPRVLRTVRHYRASQLAWRSRYMVERRLQLRRAEHPACESAAALCDSFPQVPMAHRPGPTSADAVALMATGQFSHLNHVGKVGLDPCDWHLGPKTENRLWVVTLHYHAWAHSLAEQAAAGNPGAGPLLCHYLHDWLANCDVSAQGARHLAWNSFAIATRITWWIRTYVAMSGVDCPQWRELQETFLSSLYKQARYLREHLEWDLRGNHLLRDAVGLAWAGRFFDGPEAHEWLSTAVELTSAQVDEQVLSDGGHFERSPMYHIHVMEDFLALAILLDDTPVRAPLSAALRSMAELLAWVRHPDGDIPLMNDAALGAVSSAARMLELGRDVGTGVDTSARMGGRMFADWGLAACHGHAWTVFFDAGPIGPDYQPAHAHADTLTLEASYGGRRLFVDPGTFAYDDDGNRQVERGTASHNTVAIDGTNSSEVWGIFRVGRRARIIARSAEFCQDGMHAFAAHSGYDHLPGAPQHSRDVRVDGNKLVVIDRISGGGHHRVQGGWLLGPSWNAQPANRGWLVQGGPGAVQVVVERSHSIALRLESAHYSPEYGQRLSVPRLAWHYEGALPLEVKTIVEPAKAAPLASIKTL